MKSKKRRETQLQTVVRVAQLLRLYISHGPAIGVRDAARLLNIHPSTSQRLFASLAGTGMLVRQDSTRKYVLGEWVAELGLVAAGSPGLRALAKPYLAKAQEATGETVSLHERWGDKRKITCVVEGIHEVRQIPVVGTCRPLLLGSSGKAILAFLDARERDKILSTAKWPLRTATGKEISYESLVSDLAQVREDGYSISDEETVQGAAGVSVPIFGPHGVAVACLTVSGPLQRCTRQFLQSHVPTLQALAQHISALIGGSERTSGK